MLRCAPNHLSGTVSFSDCRLMRYDGLMKLDSIQQAAQEQFAKQSHRYGRGHILENVEDVEAALASIRLPARGTVLDVATGAGHTGLYLAGLEHDVTLADIAESMLARAARTAAERGLTVQT